MNKVSVGLGLAIAAMVTSVAALVAASVAGGGGVDAEFAQRLERMEASLARLDAASADQQKEAERLQAALARVQRDAAPRDAAMDDARIRAAVERALDERAAANAPRFERADRDERFGREGDMQAMVARGLDSLGLDDEQRTKVEAILAETREKTRAAFAELREEGGGPEEMRGLFERLRQETEVSLKDVMTDAQFDAYQQLMGGRRPGRRGGGGGR